MNGRFAFHPVLAAVAGVLVLGSLTAYSSQRAASFAAPQIDQPPPAVPYGGSADAGVRRLNGDSTCNARRLARARASVPGEGCEGPAGLGDPDCQNNYCSTQEQCPPGYRCGFDGYCIPQCEIQDCSFDRCPPGYVCGYDDGCCIPHCFNGWKDADEGDVDCGGSCEKGCENGQTCGLNADCQSSFCFYGTCKPSRAAPLSYISLEPPILIGVSRPKQ